MKCKRTVLPLLGTAFEPGRLADTLNEFEDEELAEIAQAEVCLKKVSIFRKQKIIIYACFNVC